MNMIGQKPGQADGLIALALAKGVGLPASDIGVTQDEKKAIYENFLTQDSVIKMDDQLIKQMTESSQRVTDTIEHLCKDRMITPDILTEPLDAAWLSTLSEETRKNILEDRYGLSKSPY